METGRVNFGLTDVLIFLFDSKGATFEQIHAYAWDGGKTQLRKKLNFLVKTQEISIAQASVNGRKRRLYFLTPLGFKSISGGLNLKQFKNIQLKTEVANHDCLLTEVRERLKRNPKITSVFSENEIQMGNHQIRPGLWVAQECNSDGLFFIKNSHNDDPIGVALEVEVVQKQRFRLAKKLKLYADNSMSKNLYVLWVTPKSIQNILKNECLAMISRLGITNLNFYFCELEDYLNNVQNIESLSNSNNIFL